MRIRILAITLAVTLTACFGRHDGDCGPSACGACPPGCEPVDRCVGGEWDCQCACPGPGDAGADAGLGAGSDAGADAGPPVAASLTFRFSFRTDAAPEYVFLQSVDPGYGEPDWVRIRTLAGELIPTHVGCSCPCDVCPTGCVTCEPPTPVVERLPNDVVIERTWDGMTHPASTCGVDPTYGCLESVPLAPGRYVAEFCWSWAGVEGAGQVLDPARLTCDRVEFDYPDADGVVESTPCFCG